MSQRLKRFSLNAVLIAALIFSAGCIPMSEDSINQNALRIYENIVAAASKPESSDKTNKKLVLADEQMLHLSGRFIQNLDSTTASIADDWLFSNQVYVGLTRQDPETLDFLPALARDWDVSADGTVWTFILEKDIPWVRYNAEAEEVQPVRDGADNIHYVNSADLEAGLMRVLSPELNSTNKYKLFLIEGAEEYSMGSVDVITGVKIISSNEIEITLKEPCGYLDAMAEMTTLAAYPAWPTMPVNSDDMEEILEFSYGPFVAQTYTPDEQITLVKNPYWGGTDGLPEPYLEEIHYDLSEEQDVLAQYQDGKLDAVQLTVEEYSIAMENPIIAKDVYLNQGECGFYLVIHNLDNQALSSVVMRRAIAATIDKESLAANFEGGTARVLDQFALDNARGAAEYPVEIGIRFDPESAENAIDDAGMKGDEFDELILVTPEEDTYTTIAYSIADDLGKVLDLDVHVMSVPWGTFFDMVMPGGVGVDMYILPNCLDYADNQTKWELWNSEGPFSGLVQGNWDQNGLLELLEQAKKEQNSRNREEIYANAEESIINQEAVIVPLFSNSRAWLVKPELAVDFSPLFPHLETWAFTK